MQVLRDPKKTQVVLDKIKKSGKTIGFVPTMGYLHEGHLSLVRLSKKKHDITVASIFVNPLQFNQKSDLKKYPRNLNRDLLMLKTERVDFVFVPDTLSLYPDSFQSLVTVSGISKPLEGGSRPGHFAGVTTVVNKLLNIVAPNTLYLGQKDYQQFKVIERMVLDLDLPVQVKMAPIVREKDGLAMSSRNVRLNPAERQQAVVLSQALFRVKKAVQSGERSVRALRQILLNTIKSAKLARLDYAEIVDAATLAPMVKLAPGQKVLAALAVYFGKTRLIDNELI